MLKGKTVILGITGSIAAYKAAYIASALSKRGCSVHVIMTANAVNFVNPITFEELTHNRCITDTFDRSFRYNVAHVSLAQSADAFAVVPATANFIGKAACGIADDMLTTTFTAASCPKLIAPAMNTGMYENPIVTGNLRRLEACGYSVIEPESGHLACGTEGKGRLAGEDVIISYIERALCDKKDFSGRRVLVTAGPTREPIDAVRYITNHSTGKMGYALAKAAALRGADVTLVSGPTNLKPVPFAKTVNVTTARDMFEAVTSEAESCDVIIKAAAVADFRPSSVGSGKTKKSGLENPKIELEATDDILKHLGAHKRAGQYLCGFSMETENLIENSENKLKEKNLDLIVCNDLNVPGAGFGTDTNVVTLIDGSSAERLELMSKDEVADKILDKISSALGEAIS